MKPVIYSTRKATTIVEPMRSLESWDTVLVQFTDLVMTDPHTDEQHLCGVSSVPCTVSKFGNLFVHPGASCRGKNRLLQALYEQDAPQGLGHRTGRGCL